MIDDMEFTTDWVTPREEWWREIVAPFAGRPIRMLEVGFYEGRSAKWWLENLLTHPDSRLVCVDRWPEKGAANRACIAADPAHSAKFQFHAEDAIQFASRALGNGARECYDVIYSDFSKEAADIATLFGVAWRLLKPGGLYLFDDYRWEWSPDSGAVKPARPPKDGIDAMVRLHEHEIGRAHV